MFEDHEEGLAYIRQRRPICCRYECLSFARCEVVVLGTAGGVFRGINWALGCAVDGEQELVGSWSVANLGTVEYDVVFEDLSSAGFERARFVLSWEPEVLGSIRQLSSCGATVLPSVQHVLRGAENDANPRERRSLAEIGRLMQGADGMADAEALARDLADPAGPGGLAERLRRVLEAIQGLEPLLACSPAFGTLSSAATLARRNCRTVWIAPFVATGPSGVRLRPWPSSSGRWNGIWCAPRAGRLCAVVP
jgi:hypothetical protein